MISARRELCAYLCLACENYLAAEPVGPPWRQEECPMCQMPTRQVRNFTAAEILAVHEMLAAWREPAEEEEERGS